MSIVSFSYLFFILFSLIVYYIFPRKFRYIILLVSSIIYFLSISKFNCIFYLLFAVIGTYIGSYFIDKLKEKEDRKLALLVTLFLIIFLLFLLKYFNIVNMLLALISNIFKLQIKKIDLGLIAPIGISYYSLSIIGYIIDVYRGTCKRERNILKLALFSCYFPVMLSGPIIRYDEVKSDLFKPNKINWDNIYMGFTRIIYGIMKKLVVADFIATIVNKIFDTTSMFTGIFIVYGVVCYAIQIYTDFSGCMDIVLGTSQMFNIKLPENFKSPFYSKSLSEFWRRWHITLGTWSKDYIMYPLLKSDSFQKFGKFTKRKFGKKFGKKIPTILAIFILWLIIGIWHGADLLYIIAAGIIPWIYLTIGELIPNKKEKENNLFSHKLFQILKVFGLMCFIWLFVCSKNVEDISSLFHYLFTPANTSYFNELPAFTPPVIIFLILIGYIDYLIYNNKNPLEMFYKQHIVFKWTVLVIVIIMILIYGQYGPGFDAASFIYGGF